MTFDRSSAGEAELSLLEVDSRTTDGLDVTARFRIPKMAIG
jgi:hypothetical protein